MHVTVTVSMAFLATLTSANITGQFLEYGDCLCATGTGDNTRSSLIFHSSIVGPVRRPDCYKFTGMVRTSNGYSWYQLQDAHGKNTWVTGDHLTIGTKYQCTVHSSPFSSDTVSCTDSSAKRYACKLLALADAKAIVLWKQHFSRVHDNAYAYNNVRDTCNGIAASRSKYACPECPSPGAPGGHVCIKASVLRYIYKMHQELGFIHVNEIAGACHSCNSKHYEGLAVDLDTNLAPSTSSAMLTTCANMDGWGQNEGNHVHCQFPR